MIEDNKEQNNIKKILLNILIIIGIALLGMLLLNQSLEYIYRMKYLNTPCDLCAELNINQSKCIKECFIIRATYYPDIKGQWFDQTGKPMP